ncbi:type II toxin-antitoxin system prevent-host-death family antitoxin [uncultured Providencia sp.]|uniref:type II toxin-antitoxin system Phd/YefM family antitoxin n=1 Tax=uncultured Providencia sp. TaxID=390517 RepID=UPI00280519BC|nr:type II toxin-antitoxin system prevent-host-death family antitoxin [uncultured Providencia sp.]
MRKVTYTQMRNELSNILEDIRNGETVVVTQRGKQDLVIKAEIADTCNSINDIQSNNMSVSLPLEKIMSTDTIKTLAQIGEAVKKLQPSPEVMESIQRAAKQLNAMVNSEEFRRFSHNINDIGYHLENVSSMEQFKKALEHTKIKHAHIIKSLEDK